MIQKIIKMIRKIVIIITKTLSIAVKNSTNKLKDILNTSFKLFVGTRDRNIFLLNTLILTMFLYIPFRILYRYAWGNNIIILFYIGVALIGIFFYIINTIIYMHSYVDVKEWQSYLTNKITLKNIIINFIYYIIIAYISSIFISVLINHIDIIFGDIILLFLILLKSFIDISFSLDKLPINENHIEDNIKYLGKSLNDELTLYMEGEGSRSREGSRPRESESGNITVIENPTAGNKGKRPTTQEQYDNIERNRKRIRLTEENIEVNRISNENSQINSSNSNVPIEKNTRSVVAGPSNSNKLVTTSYNTSNTNTLTVSGSNNNPVATSSVALNTRYLSVDQRPLSLTYDENRLMRDMERNKLISNKDKANSLPDMIKMNNSIDLFSFKLKRSEYKLPGNNVMNNMNNCPIIIRSIVDILYNPFVIPDNILESSNTDKYKKYKVISATPTQDTEYLKEWLRNHNYNPDKAVIFCEAFSNQNFYLNEIFKYNGSLEIVELCDHFSKTGFNGPILSNSVIRYPYMYFDPRTGNSTNIEDIATWKEVFIFAGDWGFERLKIKLAPLEPLIHELLLEIINLERAIAYMEYRGSKLNMSEAVLMAQYINNVELKFRIRVSEFINTMDRNREASPYIYGKGMSEMFEAPLALMKEVLKNYLPD